MSEKKQDYCVPTLSELGHFSELTFGGNSSCNDGACEAGSNNGGAGMSGPDMMGGSDDM